MHLIIAIALFSAEKLLCCNTNWGKVLVNGIRLKKTWNFRFDSGLVYAFCYIFLNSVNCVTTSSYWVTTSLCWYKWKLCPHMKMCCALVYKSYIIFTKCFNCIFLFLSRCLSSTIFSYDITIISANVFMSSSSGKDFFFFFFPVKMFRLYFLDLWQMKMKMLVALWEYLHRSHDSSCGRVCLSNLTDLTNRKTYLMLLKDLTRFFFFFLFFVCFFFSPDETVQGTFRWKFSKTMPRSNTHSSVKILYLKVSL